MTTILETNALTRVVGGEPIVDEVSIRIDEGAVLAIVGPSGAGKSSFLRLLNRLDEPTAGTVTLSGRDYREIDPQTLRKRIGLIPQDSALQSGTVRENIAISDRIRGEPVDDRRVSELLEQMRLTGYEDRPITDLSGGERQRVSIARTLYVEPDVLLLDEPTAHLDAATEATIEQLLADRIADDDLTCVLVTHDTAQAKRLGDRVVEFADGTVVAEGEPDEVLS
ncbi:ABC transporter ATP-binding protein [Natronorubrum daqingense]|uniref:Choline transporter n=1 Tax=Natronorubrum daqingense TaxID=588898 RepID=A0A1N7F2X8_9EURY|nr:ATP-binding cassette domain-containing protein [Natronorubrum daqingense]APX97500.1 choline transporter [Natronorubrum daqingense]SIR94717.1 putative ABC transport system ATP-binding protein [Natronorubrum daqingense]